MGAIVRGAVIVLGVLFMLGGLGMVALAPDTGLAGLWNVFVGGFLVVAVVIERQRYRSEAAEKGPGAREGAGPGGGEAAGTALEPRFRPTAEVFVDPTTGHRMRVMVDPRSGERRYVAED